MQQVFLLLRAVLSLKQPVVVPSRLVAVGSAAAQRVRLPAAYMPWLSAPAPRRPLLIRPQLDSVRQRLARTKWFSAPEQTLTQCLASPRRRALRRRPDRRNLLRPI